MTQRMKVPCYNYQQAVVDMRPALDWLKAMLTAGHRMQVEIKKQTRSLEQNARLWAMLTDVSERVEWYGRKLTPDDWKHVFSASLKKQDVVPGIDGGFVVVGLSTSKMTIAEMSDLQELISAFGAERGVNFHDYQGH